MPSLQQPTPQPVEWALLPLLPHELVFCAPRGLAEPLRQGVCGMRGRRRSKMEDLKAKNNGPDELAVSSDTEVCLVMPWQRSGSCRGGKWQLQSKEPVVGMVHGAPETNVSQAMSLRHAPVF